MLAGSYSPTAAAAGGKAATTHGSLYKVTAVMHHQIQATQRVHERHKHHSGQPLYPRCKLHHHQTRSHTPAEHTPPQTLKPHAVPLHTALTSKATHPTSARTRCNLRSSYAHCIKVGQSPRHTITTFHRQTPQHHNDFKQPQFACACVPNMECHTRTPLTMTNPPHSCCSAISWRLPSASHISPRLCWGT
jgi:hypothetical protein